MHAVVVNVTINDQETARARLRDEIVPQVSGTPGFVAGYWVAVSQDRGVSVVVFESEDAARAVAGQIEAGPRDEVSFDSVEVGEVVANA